MVVCQSQSRTVVWCASSQRAENVIAEERAQGRLSQMLESGLVGYLSKAPIRAKNPRLTWNRIRSMHHSPLMKVPYLSGR